MAGLPESVVTTMKGSPPETTQDRTQAKHTHTSNSRIEIKICDPAGNRTWYALLEVRNCIDHADGDGLNKENLCDK